MPTSDSRERLRRELLSFAWNEWAQMGVLATPEGESPWAQDPEALLLLTFELGRDDPRLFDEVLDWLALNAGLVSTRRLKALYRDEDDERLAEAALDWVARARRPNAKPLRPKDGRSESLFRRVSGRSAKRDETFGAHGFARPALVRSEKSTEPDMRRPINFAFRLRQILGVGVRAEVVRYLLTVEAPWARTAALAQSAAYSKRNVLEALGSLEAAGIVRTMSVGGEHRHAIDHAGWAALLGVDGFPAERSWPRLLGVARHLLRSLDAREGADVSTYMRGSHARDLLDELRVDLAYAGIPIQASAKASESEAALGDAIEAVLTAIRPSAPISSAAAPPKRPALRFEVGAVGRRGYRWRALAANGQAVAESASVYSSSADALEAVRALRDRAPELRFQSFGTPDAQRWQAVLEGERVAVSDQFSSKSNAMRSAERFRGLVVEAEVLPPR